MLIARRARLLERIEAWDAETSRELARSCAARVREVAGGAGPAHQGRAEMIAAIADGPDPSATALAMYTTAHTFDDVDGSYYQEPPPSRVAARPPSARHRRRGTA